MLLTKELLETYLSEAMDLFTANNIGVVDNKVEIAIVTDNSFIYNASGDMFQEQLIKMGMYKDFDKEYAGFLVVYKKDKDFRRKFLHLPYLITIDLPRAKRLLRPYNATQVRKYFISIFLHEITHVFEESVKEKHPECWDAILRNYNGDVHAGHEILAEIVSYKYGFKNVETKISNELNKVLYDRIKKATGQNPFAEDHSFKKLADYMNS